MKRREALQYCTALMGYGFAASVAGFSLSACREDSSSTWTPVFMTNDEIEFVSAFADTLLPATDTPGASDVAVVATLDTIFQSCFTSEQQTEVRAGIESLDQRCLAMHSAALAKCDPDQRVRIFTEWEKDSADSNKYLWGNVIVDGGEPPFYRKLKGMCLMAYFSSEKIGEEVLNYDPVPGQFSGCIPLSEVGRSWSL